MDAVGDWGAEGRAAKRPRSWQEDVFEDEPEEDDDGDYEILLTGSVRPSPRSSCDSADRFDDTGTLGVGTVPPQGSREVLRRVVLHHEGVHARLARTLALSRVLHRREPCWALEGYAYPHRHEWM